MAKFCGNCGAQWDDTANVCGNCGTPLGSNASADAIPVESAAPAVGGAAALGGIKAFFTPARIKLGAIIAAALVLVIILITVVPGMFGARSIEKKMLKGLKNQDETILAEIGNPDQKGSDLRDSYKKMFKEMNEYFEDKFGEGFKVSYDIIDTYEVDAEDYDAYYSEKDRDSVDWEEMRSGIIRATVKGNGKTYTTYLPYTLYKENGDWYLGYLD